MIQQKLYDFRRKEVTLKRDTKAYNYSYATLAQIQEKINPILEDMNLIVIHAVKDGKVVTQIVDIEDGTSISSEIAIGDVSSEIEKLKYDSKGILIEKSIEKNTLDPQGVGSIITYYRRYNLLALLDLETEDDDGAKGSGRAKAHENELPKRDLKAIIEDMQNAITIEDVIKYKDEAKSLKLSEKQTAWLLSEFTKKKETVIGKS